MAAICYQQLLIREAEEKALRRAVGRSENLWVAIGNPSPYEEKGFDAIPAKKRGREVKSPPLNPIPTALI